MTEQEFVDSVFIGESKNINDLIDFIYEEFDEKITKNQIKLELKEKITEVSDWTI